MHQLVSFSPHIRCSTWPGLFLLGNWLAGLSLGLLAARLRGDAFAPLFLQSASSELTVSGAVVVLVLPLLVTACAVLLFHRRGAYVCCGLRGLCLGFSLGCSSMLCFSGGALFGGLLLFSGLCSGPVLLWYLWRRVTIGMVCFAADTVGCAAVLSLVGAVDALVIAPFLALAVTF